MTQEIVKVLQDKAQNLTGERRKKSKTVPNELVDADTIKDRFKTLASHPGLHSASVPGILALDINANNTSHILTGGADKTATIFNKDDEQVSHMQGSILRSQVAGLALEQVSLVPGTCRFFMIDTFILKIFIKMGLSGQKINIFACWHL